MRYRHRIGIGAGTLLGLILVTAGVGKILNQAEPVWPFLNPFPPALAGYFNQVIVLGLPRVEVFLGILLVLGIAAKFLAVIAGVMTLGFITNNIWLLVQGRGYEPCFCLGVVDRIIGAQLSTRGSLILDIIMLALAFVIVFAYPRPFLNTDPWFARGKAGKDAG